MIHLRQIGRLAETAYKGVCSWFGCARRPRHDATFRFEYAREDTGEIRRKDICCNAAASICAQFNVPFPPGAWKGSA